MAAFGSLAGLREGTLRASAWSTMACAVSEARAASSNRGRDGMSSPRIAAANSA